MNSTLDLNVVLDSLSEHAWNARCLAQLPFKENANFTHGLIHLVDAEGRAMSNFTQDTWGITIADCYKYCSTEQVPYVCSCILREPKTCAHDSLMHCVSSTSTSASSSPHSQTSSSPGSPSPPNSPTKQAHHGTTSSPSVYPSAPPPS